MRPFVSSFLAGALALTLAACAPQADPPAEPAPTVTPETAAPEAAPTGNFYTIGQGGNYDFNAGFNTGDCWYFLDYHHLGYALIMKIDFATATRQVFCRVPGCTHDSDACPAWLPGNGRDVQLFTVGDTVYAYHGVSTMNYRGSWEEYYAEVVAPRLEEPPENMAGLTKEQILGYYRNRYAEVSAPAGVYVIQGDGATRQNLSTSQDLRNVLVGWCDGTALYGYQLSTPAVGNSTGYRISLTDGSVTTFPMQQQEQILGAQGNRLLTSHTVTEVPLPDYNTEGWDTYQAVLQSATVEYDWLDPATGARSKVLTLPHDGSSFGTTGFYGLRGGKLYFEDLGDQAERNSQHRAFCSYDVATSQWKELLRPLPDRSMQMGAVTVAGLPHIAAQQGTGLWITGSDNVYGQNLAWMLNTQSGALFPVQQIMTGDVYHDWAVTCLALTDDGRFLLQTGEDAQGSSYALIDAEAFLQGSTDYTPVTAE